MITDAQFHNSFAFNLFYHRRYYFTDCFTSPGCPKHYVAQILVGAAKICTATQTLQLKAGDIFYIPRGLKYRSHWYPEGEELRFYSFGFDYFPADEHTSYALQKIDCSPGELALLQELESDLVLSPLSIGRLYRFVGEVYPKLEKEISSGSEVTLSKALEYMREHNFCSVGEVAEYCGISESGLFVKFRKHLNQTPVEVRHRILADKAKDLLRTTDLTVEEISEHLGFSSPSYFRKIFYGQTGQTPTEFRKRVHFI